VEVDRQRPVARDLSLDDQFIFEKNTSGSANLGLEVQTSIQGETQAEDAAYRAHGCLHGIVME